MSLRKTVLAFLIASMGSQVWAQEATTAPSETRVDRSSGGFYVEPMLIYTQDDTSIKTSQLPIITDDTSGKVTATSLGARVGAHVADIFFIGADGRYGRSRMQDSFYESADASIYNYGITAGVQTPIFGVRLWGTSILGGEFDPASGVQNLDLKFKNARGYRVGAGVHVLAFSLSLEYQDLNYSDTEVQSLGNLQANRTIGVDAAQNGYSLSIGFPIEM